MGACQSHVPNAGDSTAWLYIPVPYQLGQLVHQWGIVTIPPDALLETKPEYCDTRPLPNDMHITLAANLDTRAKHELKRVVKSTSIFRLHFDTVTSWVSHEREVVKVNMLSTEVRRLHTKLLTVLCAHGPNMQPFTPHITIAFCKPGLDIANLSLFKLGQHELASSMLAGWVVDCVVYEHDGKKEVWNLKK